MKLISKLDSRLRRWETWYSISAAVCIFFALVGLFNALECIYKYTTILPMQYVSNDLYAMLDGLSRPTLPDVVCQSIVPIVFGVAGAAYIRGAKKKDTDTTERVVGLCVCIYAVPVLTLVVGSFAQAISAGGAWYSGFTGQVGIRASIGLLIAAAAMITSGVMLIRKTNAHALVFVLTCICAMLADALVYEFWIVTYMHNAYEFSANSVAALFAGVVMGRLMQRGSAVGKKTLYVSDLDGTLLRSDETLSEHTCSAINTLVENGMLFSYATARSYRTASKVTQGLSANIPLIVYNGAMIVDNTDGSHISVCTFGAEAHDILTELLAHEVYPIVYSLIDGEEKFSYIPEKCTPGMAQFTESRRGDVRENTVSTAEELYKGDIFYFTCIGERERLEGFYDLFREKYHCVFQVDMYTNAQWLEIMPREATKAHAVRKLKNMLGCDKLVVFGDGVNDIELFRAADEAYAVENAADELKAAAAGVIGSSDSDGVADWLLYRR